MKKKILGLLIVIMLLGVLCVLTGCGSEETSIEEADNDTISQNEESKEEVELADIICEFTDGIAIIKGTDEQYYAIDENGYVILNCSSELGSIKEDKFYLSNGYMIYKGTIDTKYTIRIYNDSGNIEGEFISSDEVNYSVSSNGVSKSGYISMMVDSESVSGTTRVFSISDLSGNALYENEETEYKYVFDDIYYTHNDDSCTIINAKTKKEVTNEGYLEIEQISDSLFRAGDVIYNTDFDVIATNTNADEISYGYVILDKYYWVEDNAQIKDLSGNVVKDLADYGEIEQLFDYDDVIYVLTTTGYLYTMDSDFNTISETLKQSDGTYIKKTNYGIYTFLVSSNNGTLIDENLNAVYTIDSDNAFYNGTRANYNSWYLYEDFLYANDNTAIYSAKDKEILTIYK